MATHYNSKSKLYENAKSMDRDNSVKGHVSQFELFKKVSKQKSSSKMKESILAETFEKFRTRRMTVRMVEGASYRLRPLTTLHFREEFGGISCLRWSPEGDIVAVGFYSGDLKVCSRYRLTCHPAEDVSIIKGWEGNYPLSCIKFHPHNPELIYASSLAGTISVGYRRFDSNNSKLMISKHVITEEGNEINSFDFSSDGTTLVTGGKDASIRIYDTKTNKMVLVFTNSKRSVSTVSTFVTMTPEESHEKRVFCVKCHPEQPRVFLTGGWDRVVKIWDTRARESCVRDIVGPYIFGECIDVNNRGKVLTASCVAENSLDLWDLGSGCLLTKIVPNNKPVYLYGEFPYAAQFHKGPETENLVLCGGAGLGGLQLINVFDQAIVRLVEDDRPVVAIDSSEMQTVFGGKSNGVSFVDTRGEMFEEKLVKAHESLSIDYTVYEPNDENNHSNGETSQVDENIT